MTVAAPPRDVQAERLQQLLEALRSDTPFYAAHCLKIINKRSEVVPLIFTPAQHRLDAALEAQRAKGLPMRAVVLKARQLGFSTATQAKFMQRVTQWENTQALVLAHRRPTAAALAKMGHFMYSHLDPIDSEYGDLGIKPPLSHYSEGKRMHFGEPSRNRRARGIYGINSGITVDTAKEVEAGRGFTFRIAHLSEVGHYDNVSKLSAILNAVPDEPETMVVQEGTANGPNHFMATWEAAEAGESMYVPVFAAWWEDPGYALPFSDAAEREAFVASIGSGPFGADEPDLIEAFGVSPEQLRWRRYAIRDKTEGSVEKFKQEYPASPEEAFLSTGRKVFSGVLVTKTIQRTKPLEPLAETGLFVAESMVVRRGPRGLTEIPVGVVWTPGRLRSGEGWKVWEQPEPDGQYVIGVDVMGGESSEVEPARHAIQVVDHKTLLQVAEYVSRVDDHELAVQVYLAALYWNRPWVAPERTGGWGLPLINRLARDWAYPFVVRRRPTDRLSEAPDERLGWDTTHGTKPLMEARAKELLAQEDGPGIRSRVLAPAKVTDVVHKSGRHGPQRGKFADRLMAWMIAQMVAREQPIRPDRPPGAVTTTVPGSARWMIGRGQ